MSGVVDDDVVAADRVNIAAEPPKGAAMSRKSSFVPPAKVALVAWSGDASQLACRLNMPEATLTAHLKRLAQDRNGSRLVVDAIPSNSGPVIDALSRLLQGGAP